MRRRGAVRSAGGAAVVLAAVLGVAIPRDLLAQQPCASAEYRQFDFWVGVWEVRDSSGTVLGQNTIERILGGCVLQESWRSARGAAGSGHSYNIYDATTRRWHQTWVDASGTLLQLDGGLDGNGEMVMEGVTLDAAGRRVLNRITWSPRPGDGPRQRWATSTDDGATWSTIFDGYYRRARD